MTTPAKPCPICAHEANTLIIRGKEHAACSNENCFAWHHPRLIADWNTRPVEDELKAEIKRLNHALDEIISIQPGTITVYSDHTSSVSLQDYQVIKNIALFARRTEPDNE